MATMQERIARTLIFLKDRKTAYMLFFGHTRTAYRAFKMQPAGQMILTDLLKFSHWAVGMPLKAQTEFDRGRIVGRQDVIRRINQHINLTTEQLFALYNGQQIPEIIRGQQETDDGN